MLLQYFGHSCFYGEIGQVKWIIDPFIRDNPKCPLGLEDISDLTHIFISHGHSDHFGDTIDLYKKFKPTIITNVEIASYLESLNIPAYGMQIGGRHMFDFGRVKMTPAYHSSTIDTENGPLYGGNPGGFLFTIDGFTIYHTGDTGLMMDMKLLEDDKVDLMMVPIGGFYTMDLEDAIRAVDFVKPQLAIPMHYNTFPVIEADTEEFVEKNIHSKSLVMDFGEKIKL